MNSASRSPADYATHGTRIARYLLGIKSNLSVVICAVVFAWFKPSAVGGPLLRGATTNIIGEADVNTTNDLAAAFHIVESTAAASTVTFPHFVVTDGMQLGRSGNFTLTAGRGQRPTAISGLSLADQPFGIFSAPHRTLLGSALSSPDRNTSALTISGLTIEQRYFISCG